MNIIFTDGAARGNPGPGGWGTIVVGEDTVTELGGREDHTTNNRMELLAVISGLEASEKAEPATIYTDSAYVLSGSTRWVQGWAKNNWKTSKKEDVLNRDLWERLVDAMSHRVLEWKLLKGHSGIPANERCDVIATSYADRHPAVLYHGSRERYGVSLDVVMKETGITKSKSKDRSPAYSYISRVKGEIKIHKTWEECKARVHGVSGVRFKKSISPADEEEIVREFSE